jgi:hypothetical protein
MSRDSILARGRAAALIGMTDACVVRRRTGETEGPGGVMEATWDDVYTGQCEVQVRNEDGADADVGEAALVLTKRVVKFPIGAVGLQEADQITMTAARSDPDLVGRVYAIHAVLTKSHATSRRVSAVEVTS